MAPPVHLPADCERILTPVTLPPVSANDDAHVAFFKDEAALLTANGRLLRGRACAKHQREHYEGGGHAP